MCTNVLLCFGFKNNNKLFIYLKFPIFWNPIQTIYLKFDDKNWSTLKLCVKKIVENVHFVARK
jgi:hypothetical protein